MKSGPGPQRSARVQSVLIAVLVAVLVLLGGTAVLVPWFMNWTNIFAMWALLLPFMVVFGAMLGPARAARANARKHSFGVSEHECQCAICERTFAPDQLPPEPRQGWAVPPQERLRSTAVVVRAVVLGVAVIGVLLVAQVALTVSRNLGWESALIFQVLAALFVGGGFLILALVAFAMRRSDRRRLEEARQPHQCVCRWCGSTQQLPAAPAQG